MSTTEWLTTTEAAARYRVNASHIYVLVQRGIVSRRTASEDDRKQRRGHSRALRHVLSATDLQRWAAQRAAAQAKPETPSGPHRAPRCRHAFYAGLCVVPGCAHAGRASGRGPGRPKRQ